MSRLQEIHEYLISRGIKEKEIKKMDGSTISLSIEIMKYAHRNQKRENGEEYSNHPTRCLHNYLDLIGLYPILQYKIDRKALGKFHIPFEGVQEVCLLHDVIEDTDFTIEDLENIFGECGASFYFKKYIKDALIKITHIKSVDYLTYIKICIDNPVSAIVKMMDLQDNLNALSLNKFNKKEYKRASNYLRYLYEINKKYTFIENAKIYKETINKK